MLSVTMLNNVMLSFLASLDMDVHYCTVLKPHIGF
jgi:hypothetical protein